MVVFYLSISSCVYIYIYIDCLFFIEISVSNNRECTIHIVNNNYASDVVSVADFSFRYVSLGIYKSG